MPNKNQKPVDQKPVDLDINNLSHKFIIYQSTCAEIARTMIAIHGINKASSAFTAELKKIDPSYLAGKPCEVMVYSTSFADGVTTKVINLDKMNAAFRNAVCQERKPKTAKTERTDIQKAVSLIKQLITLDVELGDEVLEALETFVSENDLKK